MNAAGRAIGIMGVAALMAGGGSAWASDASTEPAADYDKTSVVICSGDSAHLVDSVTAGPLAAAEVTSIVLTPSDSLGSDARSYLGTSKPSVIYIIGGLTAVSSTAESAMATADPGVTIYRVAGNDRYATAHGVATLIDKMYAHFGSST